MTLICFPLFSEPYINHKSIFFADIQFVEDAILSQPSSTMPAGDCDCYGVLGEKQSGGEIWQLPAECIFNLSITFAHLHNNNEAINHHEIPQKCIPLRQDVFHFWQEKVVIQKRKKGNKNYSKEDFCKNNW